MKWFCNIYSMYILVLAFFPCSDLEHLNFKVMKDIITIEQQNSETSNQGNCIDLCSPLCYCGCCGSNFQVSSALSFKLLPLPLFDLRKSFSHLNILTSEHLNSLFRPPQVG